MQSAPRVCHVLYTRPYAQGISTVVLVVPTVLEYSFGIQVWRLEATAYMGSQLLPPELDIQYVQYTYT